MGEGGTDRTGAMVDDCIWPEHERSCATGADSKSCWN